MDGIVKPEEVCYLFILFQTIIPDQSHRPSSITFMN
jgi:hypothetical protein